MSNLVDYKIHQTLPGIFTIEVKDDYQRGMLFLRCQEFYESAFPEIKGNSFDIFEYMEMYRKWKSTDTFTYPDDWMGYNFPGEIAEKCIRDVIYGRLEGHIDTHPTKYDYIMNQILIEIKSMLGGVKRYYIIGVDNLESQTMKHEIAHALFYTNEPYRKWTTQMVTGMPQSIQDEMNSILKGMGYCNDVLIDETQAFMSTGIYGNMAKIKGIKSRAKTFAKNFSAFL